MQKSGLQQRIDAALERRQLATRSTYIQFMADIYAMALADPIVMGDAAFDAEQMLKFDRWIDKFVVKYEGALDGKDDEADVLRELMDERLKAIYGDLFTPFDPRYDGKLLPTRGYEPKKGSSKR